jgi:hypothetical protein
MPKAQPIEPEVLNPGEETENLPAIPVGVFNKRLMELEERLIERSIEFDDACNAIEQVAQQRVDDAKTLQQLLERENRSHRKSWARKFGIKWGSNGA